MSELSPKLAAELALDIYSIQNEKLVDVLLARQEFTGNGKQKSTLLAKTGGRTRWLHRTTDAFGICALGGPGTIYAKDMFLIFRGTNKDKTADLITDGRIGLQPSVTGVPVHIGFNEVFKSMRSKIRDIIKECKGDIETFHCIGHSLGGAVATLAADWLKSETGKNVKAYTFGCPKVGLWLFAANFTRKLKKENIYRVFHATDPVPMIPMFPYIHPPTFGYGHYIFSSESILSVSAHDMDKYHTSVKNLEWSALEKRRPPYGSDAAIEEWLKSKLPVSAGTPAVYEWLNASLIFVLKKVLGVALLGLQTTIISLHSLLDRIAYILYKGIELADAVGSWIFWLMQKIMQVLGRNVPGKKEELTRTVMRETLTLLAEQTKNEARSAITRQ